MPNYVQATVEAIVEIHKREMIGDILCFLTGQDEVEEVGIFAIFVTCPYTFFPSKSEYNLPTFECFSPKR